MTPWARRLGWAALAAACVPGWAAAAGDAAGLPRLRLSVKGAPEQAAPGDQITLQCRLVNDSRTSVAYYSIFGKTWHEVQQKATIEQTWPKARRAPALPRFRDGRQEPYAELKKLGPKESTSFTSQITVRRPVIRVVIAVNVRTREDRRKTVIVSSGDIVLVKKGNE